MPLAKRQKRVPTTREILLQRVPERDQWMNPLHLACRYGYHEIVANLLAEGADIEARDSRGRTALHWVSDWNCYEAWSNDSYKTMWILLLKDADVDAVDMAGDSPLHLATRFQNHGIVCSLLSADAQYDIRNHKGETPIWDSCRKGNMGTISVLMATRGFNVFDNEKNTDGHDLLYISRDKPEIIPLLLTHPLLQFQRLGLVACLDLACRNGYTEMASRLLAQENIDIERKDTSGLTPLLIACSKGHADIVYALLSRYANVHAVNNRLDTALHLACRIDFEIGRKFECDLTQLSIISALLAKGAFVNAQGADGKTPLSIAVTGYKNPDIVRILLIHGADPNIKNSKGATPLQKACSFDHRDLIPLLLKAGATTLNDEDEEGNTALYHACTANYPPTVQMLIENGADVQCLLLKWRCHPKIMSYLLRAGAKLQNFHYSPLDLACLRSDTALIEQEAPKDDSAAFESIVLKLENVWVTIAFIAFTESNLDIVMTPSTFARTAFARATRFISPLHRSIRLLRRPLFKSDRKRVLMSRVLRTMGGFISDRLFQRIDAYFGTKNTFNALSRHLANKNCLKSDAEKSAQTLQYFLACPHI